ncbi:MAG: hypothetical protein AVDCRST_MAG93-3597, partial [uncultured Chloroflexia bacterium]
WPNCRPAPSRFCSPTSRAAPRAGSTTARRCSRPSSGTTPLCARRLTPTAATSSKRSVMPSTRSSPRRRMHCRPPWPPSRHSGRKRGTRALASWRVRMALHTGLAEERGGDYFGQPLNRIARLLSAGHGGQVLLSTATQELVRDQLPPSA